jgi:hypothetical protein
MTGSVKRTIVSSKASIKADCPTCKRSQNSIIETGVAESSAHVHVSSENNHYILRCEGCDTIFYGNHYSFSEDVEYERDPITGEWSSFTPVSKSYFPTAKKRDKPKWYNFTFQIRQEKLSELLDSLLDIFDRGHYVFAAIGVRTAFDMTSEVLGAPPHTPFSEKIEFLRKGGHITPREKSLLEKLVDVGSAAAHRGWQPNETDVELLIETLELFINRSIVLPEGLDDLVKRVPTKNFR